MHAAFDLALAQQRVDGLADVVDGDDPLDVAGLAIDDDELRRVAERGVDRRVLGCSGSPRCCVQSTTYSPS